MSALFYLAALALLGVLAAALFVRASPARVADGLRFAGPAVLVLGGLLMLLGGRVGTAGMMIAGALAWFMRTRARRGVRSSPGRRSHVRTAALEMELDHDSGALEGVVLAGRFEGAMLHALGLSDLIQLHADLGGDAESLQLLETYLDSRFPAWRDNAQSDPRHGLGAAPASGPMTEQEAYQILGLEPGASAAEIRKAHRRLMQRLHPDLGGSSFLAARINEAKDLLLGGQR